MAASYGSMRASDADRERIAASLRDNYAAGRLTSDEFNERLDKAYAAKTLGDLSALTTDLPPPDLPASMPGPAGPLPQPVQPGGPLIRSDRFSPAWRAAVGSWCSISLICFVIWLLSGANGNLWFLWPAGICGAALLGRWVTGGPPSGDSRQARRQYRMEYRRHRRGF